MGGVGLDLQLAWCRAIVVGASVLVYAIRGCTSAAGTIDPVTIPTYY